MISGSLSCLPFPTFLRLILHICRHYATFFSEVLSGFLLISQYVRGYPVLWDSPNLSTSSLTSPKLLWLSFSFFLPLTEGTLEHLQSFCLFHIPLTLQPLFLKSDWIFWGCFSLHSRFMASQWHLFFLLGLFQPSCLFLPFSKAIFWSSFGLSSLSGCRHTLLEHFQNLWYFLVIVSLLCVQHGSFRLSTSSFASLKLLCVLFYRFLALFPFFDATLWGTINLSPPFFFYRLLRPPLVLLSSLGLL